MDRRLSQTYRLGQVLKAKVYRNRTLALRNVVHIVIRLTIINHRPLVDDQSQQSATE